MTIGIYLIRALVAAGFGVSFSFILAAGASIVDMKPTKDRTLNIAFFVFLTVFMVFASLLWFIG